MFFLDTANSLILCTDLNLVIDFQFASDQIYVRLFENSDIMTNLDNQAMHLTIDSLVKHGKAEQDGKSGFKPFQYKSMELDQFKNICKDCKIYSMREIISA